MAVVKRAPGSQRRTCLALADATSWGVSQEMEDLSLCVSPPLSVTDFSNKKHTFKKEYCTLTFKMIQQVILLEKLNIELLYDLRVSLPDILPQRMERENLKRYSHTSVHSSIIHNSPEVETSPIFTNRWGNSVCLFLFSVPYYSAFNRNEILPHATGWLNLEDTMPSEISQTFRTNIRWSYLYKTPVTGTVRDREVAGTRGKGWRDLLFHA